MDVYGVGVRQYCHERLYTVPNFLCAPSIFVTPFSNYEKWTQALAAYNMGWAHVRDARRLAADLKHNPYRWKEFKKVLPLLENEKYHSQLSFGFARGRETVQFVDSVLVYYKLLRQNSTQPLLTSRDF